MVELIQSCMLDVLVTSNINSFGTQRRFSTDITISELKQKLELITGASPVTMEIELLDNKKVLISKVLDDHSKLSDYNLENVAELLVRDAFRQTGEFEDVSKVKKFELSEEEYGKRSMNVRAFKEKFNLSDTKKKSDAEKFKEEEDLASKILVGQRCEVRLAGKPCKRGAVMFVGKTDFKPGFWIGVKYDEPLGKNDGSVGDKRYFECQPKYGGFVKPQDITVGDFPEETYDLDEI